MFSDFGETLVGILKGIWNVCSSPVFIAIYIFAVLAAVVILIANVIAGERKRPDPNTLRDYIDRVQAYIAYNQKKMIAEEMAKVDAATAEIESSRFIMLSQIDRDMKTQVGYSYDNSIQLDELCEDFRNYCAGTLKLYYDMADIRRFIAGMAVTHLIVMQGMSGTGKTSLSYAYGEYLQNTSVIVPIQPMWKERTDMIGYYNEFTKHFNETTMLCKMYEANYTDEIYITVLDEMNIARVEYYFAEFLSLLEIPNPEKRMLDVVSDKRSDDPKQLRDGKIQLPTNMWFVGTVNNDDSTFAISDKVYDRAMVLNLNKKCVPFTAPETKPIKMSATHYQELIRNAKDDYVITDRDMRRIKKLDEYLVATFHITFGNRIMKQLREYIPVYIACGGKTLEAIDDILSKKVLRKLEAQNPVYVRNSVGELVENINTIFGENRMSQCIEYLRFLERNA